MVSVRTHLFFDLTPDKLAAELSNLMLSLNFNTTIKGIYINIEETVIETNAKPEDNIIQLERFYTLIVITSNMPLNKKQLVKIMKGIPASGVGNK